MYALADGHQLYPTPDGVWHYLTPDENAVTIGAPAEDLAELDNFLRRSGSVLGPGAIEIADASSLAACWLFRVKRRRFRVHSVC